MPRASEACNMPCAGVRQRGSAQLRAAYKNARVDIPWGA